MSWRRAEGQRSDAAQKHDELQRASQAQVKHLEEELALAAKVNEEGNRLLKEKFSIF